MLHTFQRIVCPVLLLTAGVGAFVYGTWFHKEKILTDQEIEITIPPPPTEAEMYEQGGPEEGGDPYEEGGEPEGFDEFGNPIGPGEPQGPEGMGGPHGMGGPPQGDFGIPPELKPKPTVVKEIIVTDSYEPESTIVKEVTVGGLMRLASGELKRTYLFGQEPDSLCPT